MGEWRSDGGEGGGGEAPLAMERRRGNLLTYWSRPVRAKLPPFQAAHFARWATATAAAAARCWEQVALRESLVIRKLLGYISPKR